MSRGKIVLIYSLILIVVAALSFGCGNKKKGRKARDVVGTDADGDGICDVAPTGDQNLFVGCILNPDGSVDQCPAGPGSIDSDGDGECNLGDLDDDNDGVADTEDAFPLDPTESEDTDGDGEGDNKDTDDDNDGTPDSDDAFPKDPEENSDRDGDGVGDNGDKFPDNPGEWEDSDGDGVGDNSDRDPNDPNVGIDSDGDGVDDDEDCEPNDANVYPGARDDPDKEFVDRDCDGVDGNVSRAIFVAPDGDDNNLGTITEPLKTIQKAIDNAAEKGKDVYVAAMGEVVESINKKTGERSVNTITTGEFKERVVLKNNVWIYGGYCPLENGRRERTGINGRCETKIIHDQLNEATVTSPAGIDDVRVENLAIEIEVTDDIADIRTCNAVYIENSSPEFIDNRIDVRCDRIAVAVGIYIRAENGAADPVIEGNYIRVRNREDMGKSIVLEVISLDDGVSSPRISNNEMETAESERADSIGISLRAYRRGRVLPTIEGNEIVARNAGIVNGQGNLQGSMGILIREFNDEARINAVITDNRIESEEAGISAAIYAGGFGELTIDRNLIGAGAGTIETWGIYLKDGSDTPSFISNNIIFGGRLLDVNFNGSDASAVVVDNSGANITNNTIFSAFALQKVSCGVGLKNGSAVNIVNNLFSCYECDRDKAYALYEMGGVRSQIDGAKNNFFWTKHIKFLWHDNLGDIEALHVFEAVDDGSISGNIVSNAEDIGIDLDDESDNFMGLNVNSPLRNAGLGVGLDHDFAGRARPLEGAFDIGAHEYQP